MKAKHPTAFRFLSEARLSLPAFGALLLVIAFSCRPPSGEQHESPSGPPAPERVLLRHRFLEGEETAYRFLFAALESRAAAPVRIFGWGEAAVKILGRDEDQRWQAQAVVEDFHFETVQFLGDSNLVLLVRPDESTAWWGNHRLPSLAAAGSALEKELRSELEGVLVFDERGRVPLPPETARAASAGSIFPAGVVFPEEAVEPGQGWESETPTGISAPAYFAGYTSHQGVRSAVIVQEGSGNGFAFRSRVYFDIERNKALMGWFWWESDSVPGGNAGRGLILKTVWRKYPREEVEDDIPASPW